MPTVDTELLQRRRAEIGWSIQELAFRSGLSISSVWRTLSGETVPTTRVLVAIARALGLGLEEVLRNADPEPVA